MIMDNPFILGEERIKTVTMQDLVPLFCERLLAGQTVRFSPRGTSMLPMLRHGVDMVELSAPPEQLQVYDLILYLRDNGSYVLHRIVAAGDTYTCIGDNQYTFEPGIRRDQVIALVTAFRRGDREFTVDHPWYRRYCRVWYRFYGLRRFGYRIVVWFRRHLS